MANRDDRTSLRLKTNLVEISKTKLDRRLLLNAKRKSYGYLSFAVVSVSPNHRNGPKWPSVNLL